MEILVHHVSYADVYFYLQSLEEPKEPPLRLRVNRECLEHLCKKVLAHWDDREHSDQEKEGRKSISPPGVENSNCSLLVL